jgi:hypothetical protein
VISRSSLDRIAAYPNELLCSIALMLNPAKRYCSKNCWSSGASLPKNVSLKLPSILTPHAVHDIAAVCIANPQEGQEVESILLLIFTNISYLAKKVNKNLIK